MKGFGCSLEYFDDIRGIEFVLSFFGGECLGFIVFLGNSKNI